MRYKRGESTIRSLLEINSDSVFDQRQTYFAPVGAIWQVHDNLAFDVGLSHALVDGHPVNELRAGVTFGFPLNFGRLLSAEPASAAPLGRR